ncbi:MAG: hypothetical protein PVH88_26645 [Ignavibacteria bacterium]|jgi:hypothetical protein
MKTNLYKLALLLTVITVLITVSCDDDDNPLSSASESGEIAIVAAVPNPDGQSGAIYLQLIDDLSSNTYDNETALPFTLNSDQLVMRGEDIYRLPFAESDVIEKYTRGSDKTLSITGQLTMESNSSPSSIVIQNETKAYLALMGRPKILIINPSTMEKTGEIDITEYGVGDDNPDANQMVIRDDKLYVALSQMVGGYYASPDRAKVDVLIINTETDTVEKMITEESTGMSQPTRPTETNQIFIDENNDIYIVCQGGFGAVAGHKCGILRIKDGETEFDAGYSINITDAAITGENNNASALFYVQYGGNGKLYGHAAVFAYYSNPPSYIEDRTCVPVEVDLSAGTITALDLPRSNSYGSTGIYNDKIVFGLATDSDNGFFTYDINTGETSSEAIIKTTGTPHLFKHFGEEY